VVGDVASSKSVGELLLGMGSMRPVRAAASTVVGARRWLSRPSSAKGWCRLEVIVVVGVADGGVWMVL
jgi:hypothetical protein